MLLKPRRDFGVQPEALEVAALKDKVEEDRRDEFYERLDDARGAAVRRFEIDCFGYGALVTMNRRRKAGRGGGVRNRNSTGHFVGDENEGGGPAETGFRALARG